MAVSPRKVQDAVQPMNGFLVVQSKENECNSVIHIPLEPGIIETPSFATIVAAAKDVVGIKPGDVVILPKYKGSIIRIDNEDLLFIKAENILGKVT